METQRTSTVAIVGPGRLGQAMGRLLAGVGVRIGFVAARQLPRARKAVRFIGGGKAVGLCDKQLAEADIILITTSDAAIGSVARRLATGRKDWRGRIVLHACGSLPASVLRPFKERGAAVGSLHPFRSVPSAEAGLRNLPGSYWALEGDRRAVAAARRWVKALGGTAFNLPAESKPLYHLSAFLACPTVLTLMDCSERLLREAGVPKKVIRPMLGGFVVETVANFEKYGGRRSLSGPAVRGDWKTLERHLVELQQFAPEVIPAYVELVDLMLRVAGKKPDRNSLTVKEKNTAGRARPVKKRSILK